MNEGTYTIEWSNLPAPLTVKGAPLQVHLHHGTDGSAVAFWEHLQAEGADADEALRQLGREILAQARTLKMLRARRPSLHALGGAYPLFEQRFDLASLPVPREIALVAAMDLGCGIGRDGAMPWKLKRDMEHFRALTLGHPLIVGRRTFQSIGRALPDRFMIVVSNDASFVAPGCRVVPSIGAAYDAALEHSDRIVIGGGAMLYEVFLDLADTFHLTQVHGLFGCDTFFPTRFATLAWSVSTKAFVPADDKNSHPHAMLTLERVW